MSTAIQTALAHFQSLPLKDAARQFLAQLGYQSEKFLVGAGSKPQDFLNEFASGHPFDQAKALVSEWKSAELLFQLTDEELQTTLFKEKSVQRGLLKSYVFIAIELKGSDYARGKFSAITRQINRLFPMPVMVIFKCGADIPVCDSGKKADRNVRPTLTIAVINRRRNKLDESKDVLEKATLIRDISITNPHRGHLDILASLALPNLVHPEKKPITDFDTLHAAWEQIFNVELLNERFYKELANWYFWALPQVEFPADLERDDEKRRATGLIRLLTRLIFCWFLKEKGLIPDKLFHPTDLAKILKGFDPESKTSSTYYLAILQNLFFATLNQRMGKDSKGNPYRLFARDEGFLKNKATYDVNNLYRYENLFAVSEEEALALFADIPFLNGGLFECLDRTEESGTDIPVCDSSDKADKNVRSTFKKRYLDGFSRNPKKRPHIPDRLFFGREEIADLSEVYADKKRKAEKVTGLIHILNRYKFTIVENTPIDQEIALDPELLGKVFENLLASYNEETKTTARKQTGSFYTPRPIVDYMVDESLKAYLARALENVGQTFLSASSSNETTKTRRDLPHWKKDGAIYWITFRMADSLPQEKLRAWKEERDNWSKHHPEPWDDATWKEYNERFGEKLEAWLDAGMGSRALARPDVREAVKSCLVRFDGERLLVHAAVIMPNHIHALIEPLEGHDLSKLLQGIKGTSAREANKLLGTTGSTFWLDESYDHIVRSEAQYQHFIRYIAENPVKAGLKPHEYWLHQKLEQKVGHVGQTFLSAIQEKQTGMSAPLSARLSQLFTYTDEPHQFSESEVATLIAAIDQVKVLDPACGSGAFPMGVLHKLVYILGKLDPDNERWKQTQLAKLDSAPMREQLEAAFADNNDDYDRKLYLIKTASTAWTSSPSPSRSRNFVSLFLSSATKRPTATKRTTTASARCPIWKPSSSPRIRSSACRFPSRTSFSKA
jgi:REP element-mobilizing transposase RayT